MPECKPAAAPCEQRGLTWFDWASSIFTKICDVNAWLGLIASRVNVAPYGKQALDTVQHGFNEGAAVNVTVPAGALSIQATIDNEYAADNRLTVQKGAGTEYQLPAGSDFTLPAITPIWSAEEDGSDPLVGQGYYPQYTIKFPAGSRGFVIATYRGTAPALTIS